MGFSWKCPDLGPGNWHYDAFIKESGFAVKNWQQRSPDHHASVIENVKDEGRAAIERITQLRTLLGNFINFGLVAFGAAAVLSQSILKTQPFLLAVPFTLLAACIAVAAYALRPPHVELKAGKELDQLSEDIGEASQANDGCKLAHEISERKTVIIRQNVLEWLAGMVRVPIVLFIMSMISIPIVAAFGKGDDDVTVDAPDQITVVVEYKQVEAKIDELNASIVTLQKSLELVHDTLSDERQSAKTAIGELSVAMETRFNRIDESLSNMNKALNQIEDKKPSE